MPEPLDHEPVIVEQTFEAPMEAVWNAITDVDQMKGWYFQELDSFRPQVGFETQFSLLHEGKEYLHLWKVTEVTPGRKITYRWKFGGTPGESFVTFELLPEESETKIRLTHRGLETFQPDRNPALSRENFVKGWTHIIGTSLARFMDTSLPSADRDFVQVRTFDAPRMRVWQAWTDPKQMAQWWGPHHFTNPVCQMDVRPGGAFRIVMRAPDGELHPAKGFYREVTPPQRLVMVINHSELSDQWHDLVNPRRDKSQGKPALEAITMVNFDEDDGQTKMTIRQRFESAAVLASLLKIGMKEGWSQSLERLTKELASNSR